MTPDVPHSASLAAGLHRLGLDLPAAAVARLSDYAGLLAERAVPLGMIGPHEAERVVPRHVIDSLRAASPLARIDPGAVVDLGSGAGLPGIPLAIAFPDMGFTLAEPRTKRAAFLELVVERLALSNVLVRPDRAETLDPASFDAATARAFASPDATWRVARRLLEPGGALLLFAGSGIALPERLEGAASIELLGPGVRGDEVEGSSHRPSSIRIPLASNGHLVMIRAT